MSYRKHGGHADSNQGAIVDALRKAGASVEIISGVGFGCPDLLVGYRGRNLLLEVKPGDAKDKRQRLLNENEKQWHARWRGRVSLVRSPEEALATVLGLHPISPTDHTAATCDDPTCRAHWKDGFPKVARP